jgi:hypothetical protein
MQVAALGVSLPSYLNVLGLIVGSAHGRTALGRALLRPTFCYENECDANTLMITVLIGS